MRDSTPSAVATASSGCARDEELELDEEELEEEELDEPSFVSPPPPSSPSPPDSEHDSSEKRECVGVRRSECGADV
jgi:hypothetical protein